MIFKKSSKPKLSQEEAHFLKSAEVASMHSTSRLVSFSLYGIILMFLLIGIWAYFTTIPDTQTAFGKIVSSKPLQVVQHLEGGIIKAIHVKEGDHVKQGQVLVSIDDTWSSAVHRREDARLALLNIKIYRHETQLANKDTLSYDKEITKKYPHLVKDAIIAFNTTRDAHHDRLKLLKANLQLVTDELRMIEPLARKQQISKLEVIRLKRTRVGLQTQIHDEIAAYRKELRNELDRLTSERLILTKQIEVSKDRLKRVDIRAPADGIINALNVGSIGGVLQPATVVAEIVPDGVDLEVEVRVPTSELGNIKLGQEVTIKIDAYEFSIYGQLKGKITNIGADSQKDEQGREYFEVQVMPDSLQLPKHPKLRLRPGMSVTVNIIMGYHTLLDFLIQPVIKLKQMQEQNGE